jgi:exodeoxyribonuclease VII large subunit
MFAPAGDRARAELAGLPGIRRSVSIKLRLRTVKSINFMNQIKLDFTSRRQFTVSELNAAIRRTLAGEFTNIWVQGEISGFKLYPSGHAYFTLKDAGAQLRCVCFRGDLRLLKVKPADGLAVLARGRLDVYEPRGEYQLIVEAIELFGRAELYLAFEALKARLQSEGLFEAARKRPLPRHPRRIGIVTSPKGAVIRDMISILHRRWPGINVRLFPAQVQGAGAVEALVAGIRYFSTVPWADLVIVGRGGGSIEDLWAFNDEAVARAIAACPVPVISAVGHETDFTIADFVADVRAPTPSAAAELAVPRKEDVARQLASQIRFAYQAAHFALSRRMQRLDELDRHLRLPVLTRLAEQRRRLTLWSERLERANPAARLADAHRRLATAAARLEPLTQRRLTQWQTALARATTRIEHAATLRLHRLAARLEPLAATLLSLSPQRVLDRGYAIVQLPGGQVVRTPTDAPPGTVVDIRLASGRLAAKVLRNAPRAK